MSVYYGNRWFTAGYVNDVWKATPNLTFNFGIRLEHMTLPQSAAHAGAERGLEHARRDHFPEPVGTHRLPHAARRRRVFAGKSGNTSIRAGFGINLRRCLRQPGDPFAAAAVHHNG